MNVLVNGIGNIGTTLLTLLIRYQKELEIDTVFALKNNLMPWQIEDLNYLKSLGIVVCSTKPHAEYLNIQEIIDKVDYIFDCTSNGGGLKNKKWYDQLTNLKGASAQGSEKAFGLSFMAGINNNSIRSQKYAHIVSCNTHAIASILTTFCGSELENMDSADFVIVRRSEDLGNHERLVSANVVARHLDNQIGTHHSIDVIDLFETIGKRPQVTSSDITTPSQLMHGVRFNVKLKKNVSRSDIKDLINVNSLISTSTKFDSNKIFERGRRLSPSGRIYSHAIVIENNLMIIGDKVIGWAFIPQEGNTLLSTINAFLLQTGNILESEIMKKVVTELVHKEW